MSASFWVFFIYFFFILLWTEKQQETLSRFNHFFIGCVDVYSRVRALIISCRGHKELFLWCRDYEFASSSASWPPVSVLIEGSVRRHSCRYAPAAALLVVGTPGWIIRLPWNETSTAALIRRPKRSHFHWFNFPVRSREKKKSLLLNIFMKSNHQLWREILWTEPPWRLLEVCEEPEHHRLGGSALVW